MKIAFISSIFHFPWGGADTLWTRAAEDAIERGDSALIVVSDLVCSHPRVIALERKGAVILVRPRPLGPARLPERVFRRLHDAVSHRPLLQALNRLQPDLIVVSCGGTYDLLCEPDVVDYCHRHETPLRIIANFQVENPALTEPDRLRLAVIFQRLNRIFFVSTRNLRTTQRHLLLPLPNAAVLHNPLRCNPTDRLPWPTQREFSLATVSRFDGGKGIVLLLHALAKALEGERDWRLDLFGRGPEEAFIRATISALKLEARVSVRGYVDSLSDIWRDRHLLFSPALEDGVPMTIPEAMLLGRVVLATAVGGAEDWISDGQSGYLCPAPTLPILTEAIYKAWHAREHWPAVATKAADEAARRYRPSDFKQVIAPL